MGKRIPIDDMIISWIIGLPYQGKDLDKEFMGKDHDKVIV